ncbi:hypothetical protein CTU88_46130 [Streptomyces sp. JV178]|uniref:Head-to-tail connector complex protein n=1 Tax=Streptomyces phage Bing TaxID=2079427 RepID=A0A2L1IW66_9CAUD|nr:hypothetical protein [Streptomyces sp. JV178]YP_009622803.1 virion structural protein [Streptomyces phage Bing]AVD99427.1 hypothetical protein SEA_BING_5 [Streptomyces phage Bing]PIM65942.1 hypothetical protein CTU88_46130 [Streptomyces sp. JV178]
MEPSILKSTKKILGVGEADTSFDVDIMLHINSVLSVLTQVGIGPDNGYSIEDDTATWGAFIGTDPRLNLVKTYLYLKVRLLFDPPGTSYAIDAMEKQIAEFEWRLNVMREEESWTDPTVPADPVV